MDKQFALRAASCALFAVTSAALASAQISFQSAVPYTVGAAPDAACAGDFNADGKLDLAVTGDTPDAVTILTNNGNGAFTVTATIQTGSGTSPHTPVAGNLDTDGDIDIAVSLKGTGQVLILVNNGGTFTTGPSFTVGTEPREMEIGYLDSDLDLDLAVSNRASNTVSTLINNGSLSFAVQSYPAGSSPRELFIEDLTGDGVSDIAVASHNTNAVHILANSGSGTFAFFGSLTLGTLSPEGLFVGRIDGDTRPDILATGDDNGANSLALLVNQGSGTFAAPTYFPLGGTDAVSVVAADFDLDGDRDVATANQGSNDVSVLTGDGLGSFSAAQPFAVGTGPAHIFSADLDDDNARDLIVTNETTNDVSVLINQAVPPPCQVNEYCKSKLTSIGSLPRIGSTGTPSATTNNFVVTVSNALPSVNGLVFFSISGRAQLPFQGGVMCVDPPVQRMPALQFDGAGGAQQPISITAPMVGTQSWYQWWFRDPNTASTTGLSNGLEVNFCN